MASGVSSPPPARRCLIREVDMAHSYEMTQWTVYAIEWAVLLGFIGALLYRPKHERRDSLKKSRKVGCLSGGCLLPLLFLIGIAVTADSAADLGGPVFWPLFAALGAALGFAAGTLYFILFLRSK